MKLRELREEVCRVNRGIVSAGLVTLTWGNASGIDRASGLVAIKPSGVPYDTLRPGDIVLVAIEDGAVADGSLKPSSDTPTHLHLYRKFPAAGGIVHTHSREATSWAQAGRAIPCFGTTQADHFRGTIPVTRALTEVEIAGDYELVTGIAITDTFDAAGIAPDHMPGCLVRGHAPFAWGPDPAAALENAIVLEEVAAMARRTLVLDPDALPIAQALVDKHFLRKHGSAASYGQA